MAESIHIDIKNTFRQKMPKYAKYIPGFVYRWVADFICQDELNRLLDENEGRTGWRFAEGLMKSLDITLKVEGMENIPETGRFVFACNHPLGGLDGIALIGILGKKYDDGLRCMVNDILMAVKPLENVFLPINKHGAQSKASMKALDEAYMGDFQILMFPAGLCSRKQDNGEICDLEWKKSFIAKSVETQRDVIPIHFEGLNSQFFYKFARFRKRAGIKFNLEMVRLPREMVKSKGTTYTIHIGKQIPYTVFDKSRTQQEWAKYVKDVVYSLK